MATSHDGAPSERSTPGCKSGYGPRLASLACRLEGGFDRRRIRDLDRLVAPALKRDGVQVFVDITGVTSMDSTGLAWLLRTQEALELLAGSLLVVAAGREVLPKLLSLTGLDDQVVVFAPRRNAEQETTAQAL